MKRTISLIILLFFSAGSFSQNAVQLLRPINGGTGAIIVREINVPLRLAASATRVAQLNPNDNCFVGLQSNFRANIELERVITANSLKNPVRIYGPYKYLKAYSRASRNTLLVNTKYLDNWKHINTTGYYNGAHHLINKSTIKLIYADLKAEGKSVRLEEMQANSPAIFHPLHGDMEYREIFHNSEKQYEDYKKFGMKVTVISALEQIDRVSISIGLPPYPKEYLEGVLKEAELWCKYYDMKW